MLKIKKFTIRIISLVLSWVIVISVIPLQSVAVVQENLENEDTSVLLNYDVESEMINERSEFSKVYKLQNGNCYEIISPNPLHENVNGEWVEPGDVDMNEPSSTSEIIDYCSALSETIISGEDGNVSTFGLNVSDYNTPDILYKVLDASGESNSRLTNSKLLVMKIPNAIYGASNKNQVTIDCKLHIDCQNPSKGKFYVYRINENWDYNDASLKKEVINVDSNIIDFCNITSQADIYSWDITDVYLKWEKGIEINNGVAIKTIDNAKANIGGCYITRQFKIIDSYDSDFTYHNIDMGRAGVVYVNDFTNSILLARKEIGFDSNLFPVELQRFFDFGKKYATTNPSGEGARWNYDSKISMVTAYTYSWETFDGSTIHFCPGDIQYKWTDVNNEGYVLSLNSQAENNNDFSQVTITTPENIVYRFGSKGKVVSITDQYENMIQIVYNTASQNYIDYVEDGLGRRYYFNYSNIKYVKGATTLLINTLVSIEAKVPDDNNEYSTIEIDGKDAIVGYEYVLLPNDHIALCKVTYPDGEQVSYDYDSNGYLKHIYDIDGRRLTIEYASNVSTCPSVVSLIEEVVNIDDDSSSPDYCAYLLKTSLEIDRHNNYQRLFTNHIGETELIQYNQKLKILYYRNSSSESFYADYSDDDDGNDYLSQILSPENANSILSNYNFEEELDSEDWFEYNGNSLNIVDGNLHGGTGESLLSISGSTSDMRCASQNVDIEGAVGDIYVVGSWSCANAPIPTAEKFWGIEVYACVKDEIDEEYIAEPEPLYRLAFDSTMDNESQFRLGAFELKESVEALQFRLVYSYQAGSAMFDDAFLYKSSTDNVSFFEPETVMGNSGSSNESELNITYDNRGLVLNEVTTDGVKSMVSKYVYTEDGFVSSVTDTNNTTTSYVYDSSTGMLKQKGVNDSITEYKYTPVGALKEVSTVVSGLTDNINELKTSYSYSKDRIKTISHNGMTYSFDYNSFGNIKSVGWATVPSDEVESNQLIAYDYVGDYKQILNRIEYANGDMLTYNYDENTDDLITIYLDNGSENKLLYKYIYENDELSEIIDYDSGRVIKYTGDNYSVEVLLENGDSSGEKLYSVYFDENGNKTISFFESEYTINNSEYSYDDVLKETRYSSGCDFNIGDINVDFRSSSVSDFFGRLISSEISFKMDSVDNSTHIIKNSYTYDDYTTSVDNENLLATTNLINVYKSEVIEKTIDTETESEVNNVLNTFTSMYEYDSFGRVTHVYYSQGSSAPMLSYFYEYDAAGQLVLSIDKISGELTKYKYDSGGNITLKEVYTDSEFDFDDTTDTINIHANAVSQNTIYGYNDSSEGQLAFPDLLTSYNDHNITYDENGNPLKYYGGLSGDEYEWDLYWEGTLLKSASREDIGNKYEYCYDENGLRTKKTMLSFDENSNEYNKIREINYIWDDGLLVGYQMNTFENDIEEYMVTIKLLYDEYDNSIGIYYHVDGNLSADEEQVFSDDNIFWFIKDGQGNVQALYSDIDDFTLGCHYDAYGDITVELSGRFMDEVRNKIDNATSIAEKLFYITLYALPMTAAVDFSLNAGQISYRGYMLDMETGLYYCENRFYSPDWGRFINMDDPAQLTHNMEEPLNANLYVYCYNDPINNVDPSGKSSYSLSGVGLQAEMSACLLTYSGEVGIELIYVWSKNAVYGYFYYGGGAGAGYTNRAINYFKSSLKHISMSPKVSLKNMANMFKLNWSITLGFFAVFTDKSFSWPNSYAGTCKTSSASFGKWKGYKSTAKGCKAYGICYAIAGNSGFAISQSTAKYSKISFDSSAIKSYLSAQRNTIKNAVS